MLIKEIEPIGEPTTLLENEDIIDRIIELPLRKACKVFREKGIETVMSSANRNNILEGGVKPTEKEDIYGTLEKLMESHYFTEAGNGYAWIMLNYNSLSLENKKMLFKLEEAVDEKGNNIGEKLVWFVHPFEMNGNIEYGLRSGRFSKDYLKNVLGEEHVPDNIEMDPSLEDFDKRHIVLLYPWETTTEAVFLRMPLTKDSTVSDVEEYFLKLASYFKKQDYDLKTGIKL